MTNPLKIFIGLCVALFLLVFVLDDGEPKRVIWRPTYEVHEKHPLDLYVFNKELDRLVGEESVARFGTTPYEYLTEHRNYSDSGYEIAGTITSVGQELDDASLTELMLFVASGNSAFISEYNFSKKLADSLHFKTKTIDKPSSSRAWTVGASSGKNPVTFKKGGGYAYFDLVDQKETQVLGYVIRENGSKKPNYVRIRYRNGYFYLHLDPQAFSNYYLLHGKDARYAESVLTLVPHDMLFFFTDDARLNPNNELTRFLYNNLPLRWAWWIFLFGLLVFIFFNAKRRQRVIPIVPPLTNTTVEFVQTVANLYRQEGDHGMLAEKKIIYFLERIRQDYGVSTTSIDEEFIKRLQSKSGKPEADIRRVCEMINNFKRNRFVVSEDELIAFNAATEIIFS